jgi:UDP-2,4-diacetamido-2,4,6-trideoxy-beta-L-altropyranose hydrolase
MKVLFRTDASRIIGTGHLVRCLTLAEELRYHGGDVSFICRTHDGHYCDLVEKHRFCLFKLTTKRATTPGVDIDSYVSWLGVPWEIDAAETLNVVARIEQPVDWLIVDHYAIDQQWERRLRPAVNNIFVIDDLANRKHDCDLLLDQNLTSHMNTKYTGKIPPNSRALLGPKYALLQPEFNVLTRQQPPPSTSQKQVFIYFGGADIHNFSGRALCEILALDRNDLGIDVVISERHKYFDELNSLSKNKESIKLHINPPTLAPILFNADISIGACGATTWERLCLHVFSLVITLTDNQRPVAETLHRLGYISLLGHYDTIKDGAISSSLLEILDDPERTPTMRNWNDVVDGLGTGRVRKIINSLGAIGKYSKH